MAFTVQPIDPEAEVERIRQLHKAKQESMASGEAQSMFQTLFLAQLKSQDPLDPVDNKDFLTQLSQFNSLELLNSINANLESSNKSSLSDSAGLIGKAVSGISSDTGLPVGGLVQSIKIIDGEKYLNLGEKTLKPSDVLEVTDMSFVTSETSEI